MLVTLVVSQRKNIRTTKAHTIIMINVNNVFTNDRHRESNVSVGFLIDIYSV